MAALLRHWRRQHTCFWCFAFFALVIGCMSAFVGGLVGGWFGAALVGPWGAAAYFWGFMAGVDEADDNSGGIL